MKAKKQHVDALKQSKNNQNSSKIIKISQSFKQLTNNEKLQRINGAVNLLQQLKDTKFDENQVCVIKKKSLMNIEPIIFRLDQFNF